MADSQNESKWGSRENFFGSTGINASFAEEAITPSFVQAVIIKPITGFIEKLERINGIKPTDDSKQGTTLLIEKEKVICAQLSKIYQVNAKLDENSKDAAVENNPSLKTI